MKIPVAILTYRRPDYLAKTLETFIDKNGTDMFIFLILTQNTDKETAGIISKYKNLWYEVYDWKKTKGCAAGYTFIMNKAVSLEQPYVIHLQDDWRSDEAFVPYVGEMVKLLMERKNIGIIRLRSIKAQVNSKNRITHKFIFYRWVSENVIAGNAHFTLNPTFARTDVIKRMLPVTRELDSMQKYHDLGLLGGQLVAQCFNHIGFARAKTSIGGQKVWIK